MKYYWRIDYEITNCHMCKSCNYPTCIYHHDIMLIIASDEREAIAKMKERIENEFDYTPNDIGEITIRQGDPY